MAAVKDIGASFLVQYLREEPLVTPSHQQSEPAAVRPIIKPHDCLVIKVRKSIAKMPF